MKRIGYLMDGQKAVCDASGGRDVSHMFRACFAMFREIHAGNYACFAHVSRCFAVFRNIR